MPPPKDRRNAAISELEKNQADLHLNEALRAVHANIGPSPVLVQIRAAMKVLGIEETP